VSTDSPTATEAEIRDIVGRFTEQAWNKGDLDLIDELFAEDYVGHDAPGRSRFGARRE